MARLLLCVKIVLKWEKSFVDWKIFCTFALDNNNKTYKYHNQLKTERVMKKLEVNVEYSILLIMGYIPYVMIQGGMTEKFRGEITKIKINEQKEVLFYWDFFDYGWYTIDQLRSEAQPLAQSIMSEINGKIG